MAVRRCNIPGCNPGKTPRSTKTFLPTCTSFACKARENRAASTSICVIEAQKYGRICIFMIETKIQNASSSGERSSKWPTINVKPDERRNVKVIYKKAPKAYPWCIEYLEPCSNTPGGVTTQGLAFREEKHLLMSRSTSFDACTVSRAELCIHAWNTAGLSVGEVGPNEITHRGRDTIQERLLDLFGLA